MGAPSTRWRRNTTRLALAVDRDRALWIGGRPVLLRLAEPREAALLIAQPHERLESVVPSVGWERTEFSTEPQRPGKW